MTNPTLLIILSIILFTASLLGTVTCVYCIKVLVSKLIRYQPNKIYVKRK